MEGWEKICREWFVWEEGVACVVLKTVKNTCKAAFELVGKACSFTASFTLQVWYLKAHSICLGTSAVQLSQKNHHQVIVALIEAPVNCVPAKCCERSS